MNIHRNPKYPMVYTLIPFVMLVIAYMVSSHYRLVDNPQDKLIPSFSMMYDSMYRLVCIPDKRTGDFIFLNDTIFSLTRLLEGLSLSAIVGLLVGVNMALYPYIRTTFLSFVTFLSIIPPLAILPIFLIVFGTGEWSKVALIFIGTMFMVIRDIYTTTCAIPKEQITKTLTLGASEFSLIYRVVIPQVLPKLFESMRLSIGSGWLYLIASEAIASTEGLGYRIFLVRRYLSMDIIIPYVLWIAFLGFLLDFMLCMILKYNYKWYLESKR